MTTDPAAFRPDDIAAIYHERPRCFILGLWQHVDAHHSLGRGYKDGFRKANPDRKMFSSILNFAPVHRDVHNSSQIDCYELRRLFLRIAREHVNRAVQTGSYEMKQLDRDFFAFSSDWLDKNF